MCRFTMAWAALFAVGCGPICASGTPVDEVSCQSHGSATLASRTASGSATALPLQQAETSASGGPFMILLADGTLSLVISSSFPDGATTYTLPSPVVIVEAATASPNGSGPFESLHATGGTLVVATATDETLDLSGSVTLAGDAGDTFTVSGIAVHSACTHELACR